jgi:hypothetical protein
MSITVYDITATKIKQLPESLAEEVNDFIDFLMLKHDALIEDDFCDYLKNLEDYENRLSHGEIKW